MKFHICTGYFPASLILQYIENSYIYHKYIYIYIYGIHVHTEVHIYVSKTVWIYSKYISLCQTAYHCLSSPLLKRRFRNALVDINNNLSSISYYGDTLTIHTYTQPNVYKLYPIGKKNTRVGEGTAVKTRNAKFLWLSHASSADCYPRFCMWHRKLLSSVCGVAYVASMCLPSSTQGTWVKLGVVLIFMLTRTWVAACCRMEFMSAAQCKHITENVTTGAYKHNKLYIVHLK